MLSGMTDTAERTDLTLALSLALGAVVLGSFLPWADGVWQVRGTEGDGNVTLLLAGAAGALVARWRLERGEHRGWLAGSLGVSAVAAAVLLYEVVRVTGLGARPQGGLFLAATGALSATALSAVLLQRTRTTAPAAA
jgi:hypothetical protein